MARFLAALLLYLVYGLASADNTPLLGIFNMDNAPVITMGTANQNNSNICSFVNGVKVTGAAAGTAPSISTVASPVCNGGDTNQNLTIAGAGTGIVTLGVNCTASGATPQTCNGQRGVVTTNSLSTAAGVTAAYVINDSSVTAASVLSCDLQTYSGTLFTNGLPTLLTCQPGAGTITIQIGNTAAANALSGTVGIGFIVAN
jgi:hypothetical protein